MTFKLTKDHIGKKVRHPVWKKDDYWTIKFIGETIVVFQTKEDTECWDKISRAEESMELYEEPRFTFGGDTIIHQYPFQIPSPSYEEPKPEVWFEEGKVYRRKDSGKYCRFIKEEGRAPKIEYSRTPDFKSSHTIRVTLLADWIEEAFEEYVPKPKTIRMAPALIILYELNLEGIEETEYSLTDKLFRSEDEAKRYLESAFIKWPASDNLWVDVPIQEGDK